MVLVLVLAWLLLSVGIFLSILAAAYYAYVRDAPGIELVAKLVAALVTHTVVVIPSGFFFGMAMFAQAHSVSPVLVSAKELVTAFLILGFEALVGWLLCSMVVNRLIGMRDTG